MKIQTRIQVSKRDSAFSAAHFLAEMGKCERLHGHNYFLSVQIAGEVDPRGVVADFNALDPAIAKACAPLDHKVLIPQNSPAIRLTESGAGLEIHFKHKRYLLPMEDCLLLPLASTTVESLACYILEKITAELGPAMERISWMEVGVGEGGAQMAFCKKDF